MFVTIFLQILALLFRFDPRGSIKQYWHSFWFNNLKWSFINSYQKSCKNVLILFNTFCTKIGSINYFFRRWTPLSAPSTSSSNPKTFPVPRLSARPSGKDFSNPPSFKTCVVVSISTLLTLTPSPESTSLRSPISRKWSSMRTWRESKRKSRQRSPC